MPQAQWPALASPTVELAACKPVFQPPPEGVPAKRITILADRARGKVIVAVRFGSEEDLQKGSATLDGMNPPETGTRRRVSVETFEIVLDQEA